VKLGSLKILPCVFGFLNPAPPDLRASAVFYSAFESADVPLLVSTLVQIFFTRPRLSLFLFGFQFAQVLLLIDLRTARAG
jgi:hypothetical protein